MTTWILGPCSLESRSMYFETGTSLASLMDGRDWYFKASFDKANRTLVRGRRGIGLQEGLDIFSEFKESFPTVKLITDVHECHQVEPLSSVVDCIQVPAFLCRQTDLLVECGAHFSKINVKKGQWVNPDNILGAAEKIRSKNSNAEVWLCERGTQLGYDRLIIDFRTVSQFAEVFDKVILDCTHSTQHQRKDGSTGGDRTLAEKYMLSAPVFGYQGVFAEVHPDPVNALSDADCQIDLGRVGDLVNHFSVIEQTIAEVPRS